MGIKQVYTCDKCGKEIDADTHNANYVLICTGEKIEGQYTQNGFSFCCEHMRPIRAALPFRPEFHRGSE